MLNLHARVGVENLRRTVLADGLFHRLEAEVGR